MHNNNRRRNNMNGSGGGQHRHQNNRPRRFNNNRPQHEGGNDPASIARTRRNATQNREKYQNMARDAMASGDRVLNEYYLQHADHYHRVLLSLPPEEAPRPQYLRGHNPQSAPGEHHSHDQAHDGAAAAAGGADMPPSELPSFITQPINAPEEPRAEE